MLGRRTHLLVDVVRLTRLGPRGRHGVRLVQVALAAHDGVAAQGSPPRLALSGQVVGCQWKRRKDSQSGSTGRMGYFHMRKWRGWCWWEKVENVKCQMFISKASWVYKWVCVCGICFHGWHLGAISRSNMGDNHAKWQCIMFSWFS